MPLLIMAFAFWVAYRGQRRHDSLLIGPYLALAITDALCTLAIYGVTLPGAV